MEVRIEGDSDFIDEDTQEVDQEILDKQIALALLIDAGNEFRALVKRK